MATTPAIETDALVKEVNAVNINVNDDKLDSIIRSIHSLYEIVNGIAKDVQYIKENIRHDLFQQDSTIVLVLNNNNKNKNS